MDERELTSMEVKVPKHNILHDCSQMMKQFFDKKSKSCKCQLLISLIKSRSTTTIRRNLCIITSKNIESSNHIMKSIVVAFTLTGKKSRSQDYNVVYHVLAKSILSISTRQHRLLKCTSQFVPLHPKKLKKYSLRRDKLDVDG